jgi:hypothetical protein
MANFDIELVVERMLQAILIDPNVRFTIEPATGETYDSGEPTLYMHDIWQSGVLEGQPCRSYFGPVSESFFEGLPERLQAVTTVSGSTHIPLDERVAHLPDDDDDQDFAPTRAWFVGSGGKPRAFPRFPYPPSRTYPSDFYA